MYFTSPPSHKPYVSIAIIPLHIKAWEEWLSTQSKFIQNYLKTKHFSVQEGQWAILPKISGEINCVILIYNDETEKRWCLGSLVRHLPAGYYHIKSDWSQYDIRQAAVGWGLGLYQFTRFINEPNQPVPLLFVPSDKAVLTYVDSIYLVRDLINTPANYMMPEHLADVAVEIADNYDADLIIVSDRHVMEKEYPAIAAVGRASKHKPLMIKMEWGNPDYPELALVGKGVCYDTGGLDMKPSKFMRNMKKDMGGAAHVLGLANIIMGLNLPVHLKVYIPTADNAISGDAYRPGDIIHTRLGKTIEIDNTDAEGRLLLCDALAEALESNPDMVIDFATLTGAARVALGTEVPVFFTNSSKVQHDLQVSSDNASELIWPLPLYKGYRSQLDSSIASMLNSSPVGYGGAITAALYLQEFTKPDIDWLHIDMMAWNTRSRLGRPEGGEAMGIFAVSDYLWVRYG